LTDSGLRSHNVLMPDDDAPHEILTREQLRFEIKYGLHLVAKATRREWVGQSREKAERAQEAIVETILVRFERFEVTRPIGAMPAFWNVGNWSKP